MMQGSENLKKLPLIQSESGLPAKYEQNVANKGNNGRIRKNKNVCRNKIGKR